MTRRERLALLIEGKFKGSKAAFARAIDRSASQVNQWVSGHRDLGDAGVYIIESALALPMGWFDSVAPIPDGPFVREPWPFESFTPAQFYALDEPTRRAIEQQALGAIVMMERGAANASAKAA